MSALVCLISIGLTLDAGADAIGAAPGEGYPSTETSAELCKARYWQLLPIWVDSKRNRRRLMPTRNVSLTTEQNAFIDEVLDRGDYHNASEVMRDAIRALQKQRKMDALKLERLRTSIDEGLSDIDHGDYVEVDDAALESWLERVGEEARP
jgi:antitoxin ParD1/3/4